MCKIKLSDLYVCCDNVNQKEDITVHYGGKKFEVDTYLHEVRKTSSDVFVEFFRVEGEHMDVWVEGYK
jgi:hypothetical protein